MPLGNSSGATLRNPPMAKPAVLAKVDLSAQTVDFIENLLKRFSERNNLMFKDDPIPMLGRTRTQRERLTDFVVVRAFSGLEYPRQTIYDTFEAGIRFEVADRTGLTLQVQSHYDEGRRFRRDFSCTGHCAVNLIALQETLKSETDMRNLRYHASSIQRAVAAGIEWNENSLAHYRRKAFDGSTAVIVDP